MNWIVFTCLHHCRASIAVWCLLGWLTVLSGECRGEVYFLGIALPEFEGQTSTTPLGHRQSVRSVLQTLENKTRFVSESEVQMLGGEDEPLVNRGRCIEAFSDFCARLGSDDVGLIYVAGHAVGSATDLVVYLSEFDQARRDDTGLSLRRLREIASQSSAGAILLVLDVDSSRPIVLAGEKGIRLVAQETHQERRPSGNLAVVVGTRPSTESQPSPVSRRVCRAFEGAADLDRDGRISIQEVTSTLGSTDELVSSAPPLNSRPVSADDVLNRIADLALDLVANATARSSRTQSVSAIEFHRTESVGMFSVVARETVERKLIDSASVVDRSQPGFKIVPLGHLRTELQGAKLNDLKTPTQFSATQQAGAQEVDLWLLGSISRQGHVDHASAPDRLHVELSLVSGRKTEVVDRVESTLVVSESLWSMLGGSFEQPSATKPEPRIEHRLVALNAAARTQHPSLTAGTASMFPIQIWKGQPGVSKQAARLRQLDPARPNDVGFSVTRGDELELRLENPKDSWVAMLVSVDGLNVIGAQPATPATSVPWLFPPRSKLTLDSWLLKDRDNLLANAPAGRQVYEGRKLQVVAPPLSVAGQRLLFDDLGEIHIAVYGTKSVVGTRAAHGVGFGGHNVKTFDLHRDQEIDRDRFLAKYVLRYVDDTPSSLPTLHH